jgi:hypothetical protein
MIYLYQTQTGIEPHTDKQFAEETLGLGNPLTELTEQEWQDAEGLARMIDGALFLGKTDAENQREQLSKDAAAAQAFLDSTDYQVIKAMELGVDLDNLYPGAHAKREEARETIRSFQSS